MKFATFLRQSSLLLNSLKNIKTKIESLINNEDFTESGKAKQINKYFSDAQTELNEFKSALNALLTCEKVENYSEEEALAVKEEISELHFAIQDLAEPYIVTNTDLNTSSSSQNSTSSLNVKLPPLSLKTFNGSPEQWISFSNLFEASVDQNPNIGNSEKMQYLLTTLNGEPLSLIKNLPITPENYGIAWNILKQRYQNSRKIISYHTNNLIDLPPVSNPSAQNLRSFISSFNENNQALLALKHDVTSDNIILSSLLLRKLDSETRKRFENSRSDSQKMPGCKEIITFLETECTNSEAASLSENVSPSISQYKHPNSNNTKPKFEKTVRTILHTTATPSCKYCASTDHSIYRCSSFKELSTQNKHDFVKQKRMCTNCLGSSHTFKDCNSKRVCFLCSKKHHTWLHLNSTNLNSTTTPTVSTVTVNSSVAQTQPVLANPANSNNPSFVAFSQNKDDRPSTILLGTTLVHVTSQTGNSLVLRAVVDSASTITCITESAARLLSLERHSDRFNNVVGLSSCQVKTQGISNLNLSTLNGTRIATMQPVVILGRITSNLPHSQVPRDIKERFRHLVLADPTFDTPSNVDMLLGADLFAKILTGERLILGNDIPAAMNSVFGYIIIGSSPALNSLPSPSEPRDTEATALLTHDLHQAVQRFWTQEEPPLKLKPTPEEEFCEQHFSEHYARDLSGRYIVRLPVKENHPPLGDSAATAKRRFFSLERKLNSDPELKSKYTDCMNDYINSGDMELVTSPIPENSEHFFLPHHAVIKNDSTSTKVRVVFDASARTSTGISLNDILYSGPKLHNEISDIMLFFRCHPIICCSDIKQMFRRIYVHQEDRNYQLLFWREDHSKPLLTYRLTTVVFGFSSSPYLAIRTLKQLIKDEGENYPLAAQTIDKQIYVDDLILSADNLDAATSLQQEAVQLLAKGGFELRKWTSNCPQLMTNVPESHREKPLFISGDNPLYKVLGIKWITHTDEFAYLLQLQGTTSRPTKRQILSTVAQIYDVCGWLTPVVFWAKSFLQLLWTLGLQWDEPVPPEIADKWKTYLSQISCLNSLRIQRDLHLHEATDIQLHGFCDGSEAGYGAVIYVRCIAPDGNIRVSLLIAKSRVAPLKRISIPRMELCGAHLLAELLNYANSILSQRYNISSISAWCDSTVVLSWIRTPSYRLKVYVGNRVSLIQELIPSHAWTHISTQFNPADCASRGLLPSSLIDHNLWWQGPTWLQQTKETWPTSHFTPMTPEETPEIKLEPLPVLVTTETNKETNVLEKFSSWDKLLRVTALVLRFIQNCREKVKTIGPTTLEELKTAELRIVKTVQHSAFSEELTRLKSDKPCTSRILHLSPFIDETGLIRVGGRLKNSDISSTAKHPIILPKDHYVTNLLVDFYHFKYLHAGPQFLQATISRHFWILSARRVIRSRTFKCVRCSRCKPKLLSQKMGDLPTERVLPARVFQNCGTDFSGPYLIKPNSLRKASPYKAYLCLFICFSVKAIHIEVVTSLTSEAFLAALTRFVSRRGLCENLYSDCGKNYVGASSELKKIIKLFFKNEETKQEINRFSNKHEIKFHFLPPAAPHQGGLWERAVRSIKHHLHRVMGNQVLTLEEFITLSTRVEAILNSRPLTPLSSDPSEIDCLTPGHFLIGAPLVAPPERQSELTPMNRLSRWQLVQSMGQGLWRRWKNEYLHTLQQRGKWRTPEANIKIGDVVIIHEPNEPPLTWRMGRVIATTPGCDGLVRVVQLQTAKGVLSRAITKISPLPLE